MNAIWKLDLKAYTWDSFVGPRMILSDHPYLDRLQWVLLLRHVRHGLDVRGTGLGHVKDVWKSNGGGTGLGHIRRVGIRRQRHWPGTHQTCGD